MTTLMTRMNDTLATRRADRNRRRQLEAELAAFSTRADILDLELVLDRYPAEMTQEMRSILARQATQAA